MTDIECSKICKVLNVSKLFLNTDGMMCVIFNDNSFGHLYIYEGSFSSALPLRVLVHGSREYTTKQALEHLLKQTNDGISIMLAMASKTGKLEKSKFMTKDDTIESFLVKYDLKFTSKSKKKKRKRA